MSLVNAEQVNAVVINAATAGIVDCSMTMASTSGGSCVGTRVVFQSIALPTQCGGGVVGTSLALGVAADFAGVSGGKLKLVIPLYLNITFDNTALLEALATEIFSMSTTFSSEASGIILKSSVLRKENPGIVFNKFSLQYLNAGRIIIHKNKYL